MRTTNLESEMTTVKTSAILDCLRPNDFLRNEALISKTRKRIKVMTDYGTLPMKRCAHS